MAKKRKECTELAATLSELALNIGSQEGVQTLDDVVAEVKKLVPDVDREKLVQSIVAASEHHANVVDEISDKLNRIKREARSDFKLRQAAVEMGRHLESGTLPERKARPDRATEQIKKLKEANAELRRALGNSDPALKQKYEKQIDDLVRKLEDTSYVPPIKPQTVSRSKEVQRLEFQRDMARKRVKQKLLDMKPRTTLSWVSEIWNAPKALKATADLSAVGRQGLFFVAGHPLQATKNLIKSLPSILSESKYQRAQWDIEQRPNAPLYEKGGMYRADVLEKEEAYISKLIQKVPLVRDVVRASERHYNIFLNMMRADRFDALVDSFAINREPTLEEAKAIGKFVNIGTGRGTLEAGAKTMEALNAAFWSPRYLVSRFQLLLAPLSGFRFGGGSIHTRKAIAKEYVRFAVGMATVYYMMALAFGDDEEFSVETDPRSSDFMKFKFGNTRIDPLAGMSQVAVLGARVRTGETKTSSGEIRRIRGDVPFGQDDAFDVGAKFVRSKFSPTLGTTINLLTGQDPVGNKFGPGEVPAALGVPLVLDDIYKAAQDEGYDEATAYGIAAFFGWGLQTYDSKTSSRRPSRPSRPRAPSLR